MPPQPQPSPDRRAATLLQVLEAGGERPPGGSPAPGAGSADCRIDLKLLIHRAEQAMAASEAASAHLEPLSRERHPDLWAGTVQDGVARGFAARLEEACSLAPQAGPTDEDADRAAEVLEGRDLRRKKDLLVASGGARARFSRKGGVLLVDRDRGCNSENCMWFEAQRDHGTLDGFAPAPDERPRLFSAQHLQPVRYAAGEDRTQLTLRGRLGSGEHSWPCLVTLTGIARQRHLRIDVELPRIVEGWRLRSRFLGVPNELLAHRCAPVRELVENDRGGFVADTLVRSCPRLAVGEQIVPVPAAAAPGALRHEFCFGGDALEATP